MENRQHSGILSVQRPSWSPIVCALGLSAAGGLFGDKFGGGTPPIAVRGHQTRETPTPPNCQKGRPFLALGPGPRPTSHSQASTMRGGDAAQQSLATATGEGCTRRRKCPELC